MLVNKLVPATEVSTGKMMLIYRKHSEANELAT